MAQPQDKKYDAHIDHIYYITDTSLTKISEPQRSSTEQQGPSSSPQKSAAVRTAGESLKLALTLAEKALDGLPIPGAKGAIGGVLKLIENAEVRA